MASSVLYCSGVDAEVDSRDVYGPEISLHENAPCSPAVQFMYMYIHVMPRPPMLFLGAREAITRTRNSTVFLHIITSFLRY